MARPVHAWSPYKAVVEEAVAFTDLDGELVPLTVTRGTGFCDDRVCVYLEPYEVKEVETHPEDALPDLAD